MCLITYANQLTGVQVYCYVICHVAVTCHWPEKIILKIYDVIDAETSIFRILAIYGYPFRFSHLTVKLVNCQFLFWWAKQLHKIDYVCLSCSLLWTPSVKRLTYWEVSIFVWVIHSFTDRTMRSMGQMKNKQYWKLIWLIKMWIMIWK